MAGKTLWIRTNDLYEVTKPTKRLRYSVGSSESVGPDLKVGDRFRAAAVGQSAMDSKVYVITDGLTRVLIDDLKYVDDEDKHDS